MKSVEKNRFPVAEIYQLSEKLQHSIDILKAAGMLKKAEAAQFVIDDIHSILKLQIVLINSIYSEQIEHKQKLSDLQTEQDDLHFRLKNRGI